MKKLKLAGLADILNRINSNKFARLGILNMIILLIGLSFYWVLWSWAVANIDMTSYQVFITNIICSAQSLSGWPVELIAPTVLQYSSPAPGFGVEIIALCTGLGEMLFFAFLVILYFGVKLRTKAKGLALFLPIIFMANIFRLLALYPLAEWIGIEAMWSLHWHIWKWGMFIVLMAFFVIWYILMAKHDLYTYKLTH